MKLGDIRLPKNAGRIISSGNRQYRLNFGAVVLETRLLTLIYSNSNLLSGDWPFSGGFASAPLVNGLLFGLVSSANRRDLAPIDGVAISSSAATIRLWTSSTSPRSFSVGDTATIMAIAIGEAP